MRWRNGHPDGRKWALVLIDGESVPFVGQYDPKYEEWCDSFSFTAVSYRYCLWCPLPYHSDFHENTHEMDALREEKETNDDDA